MSPFPAKQYAPSDQMLTEALCASPSLEPLRELTDWFDHADCGVRDCACSSDDNLRTRHLLWALFDSTDEADHNEAAKICASCEDFTSGACKKALDAAFAAATTSDNSGPEGTWAGLLVGAPKKQGRPQAPCGTDAGYHRHRRAGEDACDPCKKAASDAVIARKKKRENAA